uniref:ferredoxin:thioredoxin reductase n=1 Tax=Archaeoglobus fulgidus TaxID=2234 RepID=A0A7C3RD73_ARCFL
MEVEDYLRVFERVAEKRGWMVNPDSELLKEFARGLIENKEKYGIATCPCRLVTGKKEIDRLIICPCVYAEDDIKEYGRCYCGLYLSREIEPAESLPDRHAKYYLEI